MKPLLLAALLATTSLPTLALAHDHDGGGGRSIDKVNGGITAEAGQAYGDLSTVNGGISLMRGVRAGNVETVNGGIDAEDDVTARSVETVNGGIHFGARAAIDGDVSTVNGGVFLGRASRVGGDVETVNGAIGLVDTELAGGIDTVNGDITVGTGSHVRGGIHVEKPGRMGMRWGKRKVPRIVIGENAVVEGELRFEREVELLVHASARIGRVTGATARRYSGTLPPRG